MRTARSHRNRATRGSATLELALSLPLMLTMGFGAIEFGRAFVVRGTLVTAAAEAARVGSRSTCPRPTTAEVLAATTATLESSGLDAGAATIRLSGVGGESGTDVVVDLAYDVSFPVTSRLLALPWVKDGMLTMDVHVSAENE